MRQRSDRYRVRRRRSPGRRRRGERRVGKALAGSSFVADASEADLVALITTGRPSSDPANSTGVDMPPKGGNPSLSEQSIRDVVAYLKTLD
jgi:disulfide bond formation protein DsbB